MCDVPGLGQPNNLLSCAIAKFPRILRGYRTSLSERANGNEKEQRGMNEGRKEREGGGEDTSQKLGQTGKRTHPSIHTHTYIHTYVHTYIQLDKAKATIQKNARCYSANSQWFVR